MIGDESQNDSTSGQDPLKPFGHAKPLALCMDCCCQVLKPAGLAFDTNEDCVNLSNFGQKFGFSQNLQLQISKFPEP